MNYLEAEPSRYQSQDRCTSATLSDHATRIKKLDLLSWLLVLASWFHLGREQLDATPEAEPRGIRLIKLLPTGRPVD